MPTIIFKNSQGEEQRVDAKTGASVMQTAMANDIDGIVAECGGSAMCATCHVYVDEAYIDQLEPISEIEEEMLDSAASERMSTSRLSCQIRLDESLDGLGVHLPVTQV